jgi:ketosteroid isomerase-like protein
VGVYATRNLTKRDLIEQTKPGGTRTIVSVENESPKIHVYGNTAVVMGHAVQHMRDKISGEKSVIHTLYTEVFILKDGRWQCVAGHYTPLAVPEK